MLATTTCTHYIFAATSIAANPLLFPCFEIRSACDDVSQYLDIPVPLNSDLEIDLDVALLECPPNGELPDELDEVVVSGGKLTLRGTSGSVR